MKYRKFNNSGLYVSEIGIGTNRFGHNVDQNEVKKIIHYSLDEGINYIDTFNTYANGESEVSIGKAYDNKRKSFIVGTKVGWPNEFDANQGLLSSKSIFWHVDQSLKKYRLIRRVSAHRINYISWNLFSYWCRIKFLYLLTGPIVNSFS